MGDKRLNFNQPLLSVRRGSSSTVTVPEIDRRKTNKTPLPCHKSELNSGPLRNPSVIPFLWEQIPGRPKDGSQTKGIDGPPPLGGMILNSQRRTETPTSSTEKNDAEFETLESGDTENNRSFNSEDSNYLDALDTLSRNSSFLNCSLSGLSGGLDEPGAKPNGTLSSEDQNIVMGRFLPAAQAVALDKPQFVSRKPPIVVKEEPTRDVMKIVVRKDKDNQRYYRVLESLSYHPQNDSVEAEEDVDEEEDSGRSGNFPSAKLCGLLPRFCLLNPVPGLRDPAPPVPVSSVYKTQQKRANVGARFKSENKAIADAVYERRRLILHQRSKQRFGNMAGGNLKNESKKLLPFELGSLQLDDEASKQIICVGKNGGSGSIPPYRSLSRGSSLMQKEKGFLGIPEPTKKDSWPVKRTSSTRNARFRELLQHQGKIQEPSSTPNGSMVKTLYIDSAHATEDCQESNSSSSESRSGMDSRGRNPSIDYSLHGIMSNISSDDKPPMSHYSSNFDDCTMKLLLDSSNCEMTDENKLKKPQDFQTESSPTLNGLNMRDGVTVHGIGVLQLTEGDCKDEEERMVQDMSLIFPPPLPTSPSESWLSRALPKSGSSTHSHSRSFLGVGNLGFRGVLTCDSHQLKMQ